MGKELCNLQKSSKLISAAIAAANKTREDNMDYQKESLKKHFEWGGKIEVASRVKVSGKEELSLAYTPGVAAPCLAIKDDPSLSYSLTR